MDEAVGAGDVEVALVELLQPAARDGGLVALVGLGDLVALGMPDVRAHGEPACKESCEVTMERPGLFAVAGGAERLISLTDLQSQLAQLTLQFGPTGKPKMSQYIFLRFTSCL
jgi:hypothetical protein